MMLIKINENEYTFGIYKITKQEEKWLYTNTKTSRDEALFFDRDQALRTAIIMHTCGNLVTEAVRELVIMLAKENILEGARND